MKLAVMSLIKNITESGVAYAESKSERRNIILANAITLITVAALFLLITGRFFFAEYNATIIFWLTVSAFVFPFPILLNRLGFTVLSRIVQCWLPPIFTFIVVVQALTASEYLIETASYVGMRFFLLSFSCFPFLLFSLKRPGFLFLGLLGPLLSILLFDPILDFFGVGYFQNGLSEVTYGFNNVRAFICFVIIGGSSFVLKRLVETSEIKNEKLVAELAEKNRIIQHQASEELFQLNQQLQSNLSQLQEREFILNQSQKIAKIGSWEYMIEGRSWFWSEEMYNIFGLNKNFDLKTESLTEILWGREAEVLVNATNNLLKTGQPYDLTLRTRTPLGYLKWVRISAFPLEQDTRIIGMRGICHDVTFYKEAEERIMANEMKYRSLFEQASDAIMVTDFKGNFTDVNASLCKMFGYSKDELLHLNVSALIDSSNLQKRPIRFDALKIGDHIFSARPMIHKDGTLIEVEANVKKSSEDRVMAIVRDVSELRKAQIQIQISEARFRGAFEYSATGMALVSLEGKWMKVNRELCHITGYSEEELLKIGFQDITHPDDLEKDSEIIENAKQGKLETYRIEKRYIHKNGSIVWVNLNVSVIKDQESKPLYFVGQIEDITTEKIAQEKLIESEEQLRLFVEHSPAALAMFDSEMRYINISKRWIADYNLGDKQLLGKSHYEIFPATSERWKEIHQRGLRGIIQKNDEDLFIRNDGTFDWVRWEIHPWYKASGNIGGIIMFTEVITEQKTAQEKFTKAFDLSPDLMLILREKDLVFVEANKKVEESSGFTKEEIIGFNAQQKGFEIWANPSERVSFFENYFSKSYAFQEAKLRKKDNSTFYGAVSAQRMVLAGENHMIVVIRDITERKENQEKLLLSQANLNATINNTEIMIWSVDRDLKLLTFNEPFFKYIKTMYGVEPAPGKRVSENNNVPDRISMTAKWDQIYLRALAGEIVSLEDNTFGMDLQYSLSPIIEMEKVIGVSVFAENVTERKSRERELAEANKKIGELKLMALRSVMNPHFVFNVLNSIQFYIAKNDRLNAINYLSTFSKLIRGILTHSVNNKVKLEEEIEMLKNYVSLEMTRFENKFNFVLNVGADVDVDSIEIPSLLIQPYVENAILHGLYNKTEPGTLTINISENDNAVIFEIQDDGIGREAAIKLRQQNFPVHKSMGIKLTEERLKLINEHHNVAFEIKDLKNESGPCGTKVTIWVKFE